MSGVDWSTVVTRTMVDFILSDDYNDTMRDCAILAMELAKEDRDKKQGELNKLAYSQPYKPHSDSSFIAGGFGETANRMVEWPFDTNAAYADAGYRARVYGRTFDEDVDELWRATARAKLRRIEMDLIARRKAIIGLEFSASRQRELMDAAQTSLEAYEEALQEAERIAVEAREVRRIHGPTDDYVALRVQHLTNHAEANRAMREHQQQISEFQRRAGALGLLARELNQP